MAVKQLFFKILVGGDASVGKTTLLQRFITDQFIDTSKMTIGVDFFSKKLQIEEDIMASLQLWDIGGQERFRFMVENYLRGAHGAMLLFDMTSMKSFVDIAKWHQILRTYDDNLPVLLVSTKHDLEEFSMVGDYYAELTRKRFNMIGYVKTSSKWGLNVTEAFKEMVGYLMQYHKKSSF